MTAAQRLFVAILFVLAASPATAGPVNVNTADAETLSAELTGIGMARARAIIEYREQNGPFRSPEDLLNVRGFGERTLEMNRDDIMLDSGPTGRSDQD